jgi:hypothetical protein
MWLDASIPKRNLIRNASKLCIRCVRESVTLTLVSCDRGSVQMPKWMVRSMLF